jgi:integrase
MVTPIEWILEAGCAATGVTRRQVCGRRGPNWLLARRRFIAAKMRAAGYSLPQIGRALGRHHTSVLSLLRGGKGRRHSAPQVFLNWQTGKTYNASTVRAWFARAVRLAGLEGVKVEGDLALVPHNLRHSAASIADERGAPATWIQAMLGHEHLSTTMAYLHRDEDDNAIRMAAIMSGRRAPRKSPNVKPRQESAIPVDEKSARKVLQS